MRKIGHWLFNHKSGKLKWSNDLYHIYGIDKESFTPTYDGVIRLMHPDDRDYVDKAFRDISRNRSHGDLVHRVILSNGNVKSLREIWTTMFDDEHNPNISIGAVYDETQSNFYDSAQSLLYPNLQPIYKSVIFSVAKALESRDHYTAGHQEKVSQISKLIAKKLKLSYKQVEGIEFGAQIHDIGKISIPLEILTKPTELSSIEFEFIKTHVQSGVNIIESINFPWPIKEIISQHHERLDGSGYPNKLLSNEITLEAKIVAVADTYDSMYTNRPYRFGLPIDTVISEFKNNKGILYDPDVIDVILDLIKTGEIESLN